MNHSEEFKKFLTRPENDGGNFWGVVMFGITTIIYQLDELLELARRVDEEDNK